MNLRSALASALSISLVLLSPGGIAYAELGRTSASTHAGAPMVAPSLPSVNLPVNLSQQSLSLPGVVNLNVTQSVGAQITPSAALPGVQLQRPHAVGAALQNSHAQTPTALSAHQAQAPTRGPTALEALSAEIPDLSHVSDSSAKSQNDADFSKRVGADEIKTGASDVSLPTVGVESNSQQTLSPASEASAKSGANVPSVKLSQTRSGKFAATMLAAGVGSFAMGAAMQRVEQVIIAFPILIASLILHEMGHALVAKWLGDRTAQLQGRMSFKPRDLLTHIDPIWTIALPLYTMLTSGFIFGGAKPVPVNTRNFKNPVSGMAWVAVAGPAVNLALGVIGAIAFAGLGAIGAGPLLTGVAALFTMMNVGLAIFNLVPAYPFDGHHILRWLLPESLSYKLDRWYATAGFMAYLPGIVTVIVLMKLGIFAAVYTAVAALVVGGASTIIGAIAGTVAPLAIAASLASGSAKSMAPPLLNPGAPVPVESVQDNSAELVVVLDGSQKQLPEDAHLSFVDVSAVGGVNLYAETQQRMLAALEGSGLSAETLASYNATPIATYRRINAATLRLDAAKVDAFKAALEAQGHKVFPNSKRRIITPVPVSPEDMDPTARNPITMDENLAITKADVVHAIAAKKWGAADGGSKLSKIWRSIFGGETAPQVPAAVIDSGADTSHPLLKGVTTKNVTSGEDKDDIGHGSWVTSMVLNYAKWLKGITHYKTFVDGGATTDDILKALTASANDGNIVISNSWGSDDGDPNGPDSLLVKKLAEEGHVLVFAAGNAGPGANTIGSPAIVSYRTPEGAPRVVSVAAAGRDKKIAYFSSRGPASPMTKNDPSTPKRPDLTALGYNTDGAWPANLGGVDKVDPQKGPLKAISGTSMSTPSVAGAIILLAQLFNVTSTGAKLDAVVHAVMQTLEKTGQSRDAEGEGFINVKAAYDLLKTTLGPTPEQRSIWRFIRGK